jgi:sulfonate transport system substrate-binding protein
MVFPMSVPNFNLPSASRRQLVATGAAALFGVPLVARSAAPELRLDYAFYSPASLVLRAMGWIEEAFADAPVRVQWVLSQGSNRALENLNAGGVDFSTTAGLSALLSRANGNPVRCIQVLARPEWTALAVGRDSPLRAPAALRGRKVAVTKGTDPHLFLLRALREHGVPRDEVQFVHLQHPDGRIALERAQVDAWAGLDPHLAASEIEAGTRILYRNPAFNTFCFLNTTDGFAARRPDVIARVRAAYQRASRWIEANPGETARLLARETRLSLPVAERQLQRIVFGGGVPGETHAQVLRAGAPLLVEEALVRPGADVSGAVEALLAPV